MKNIAIATLIFAAGCATEPERPMRWVNLGWAKVSQPQASAECDAWTESQPRDRYPSNWWTCMRAKGWERRYVN